MTGTTLFHITERDDPDHLRRLTLSGELDIATAPELVARLRALGAAHRDVRLDMSELDFIDSTGLSVLIAGLKDAEHGGWRLEVDRNVSRPVARLLAIASLDRWLWPNDGASSLA